MTEILNIVSLHFELELGMLQNSFSKWLRCKQLAKNKAVRKNVSRSRVAILPQLERLERRTMLSAVPGQFIVYKIQDADIFRIATQSGAQPEDLSTELNALSPVPGGAVDQNVNISADGQWLVIETNRFGVDFSALAVVTADLSQGAAISDSNGQFVHEEGVAAISSDGNLVVYCTQGPQHIRDIWSISRPAGGAWGLPQLLSGNSPFTYNTEPSLSPDGTKVLFDVGNAPDKTGSVAIAQVAANGQGFQTVVTVASAPPGTDFAGRINGAHFGPDGTIAFEASSSTSLDRIWKLPPGAQTASLISGDNDEVSPVVLPDGRVGSLWLDRPGSTGAYELTLREADGTYLFTLQPGLDIADIGIGAGGLLTSPVVVTPTSVDINGTSNSDTISLSGSGPNYTATVNGNNFPFTVPNGVSVITIHGAGSDDVISVPTVPIAVAIDGGSGNDTLIGANKTNLWSISGANAGALGNVSFTNVENLTGNAGADMFTFGTAGSLSGSVNGGTGVNTLVGPNSTNAWNITGANAGNLNGTAFVNLQNLTGGTGADAFVFSNGQSIAGMIDGGAGSNTLDYHLYTAAISTAPFLGKATGINGGAGNGFKNVQSLIGSSGTSDMLSGGNIALTWNVTGANSGNVVGASGTFTFSSFENLTGGSLADMFKLAAGGSVSQMINGGGGSDTLVGANIVNTWNVISPNKGSLNSTPFSNVPNLTGGLMGDTFKLPAAGSVAGQITGGGGIDTLDYSARTAGVSVNLSTAPGSATSTAGVVGIRNVSGTSGPDVITAAVAGSVISSGGANDTFTGGAGNDTFILSGTPGPATTVSGGGGNNTLVGTNIANNWNITGANSGNINGSIQFSEIANLTGGTSADAFVFGDGQSISALVDGGAGSNTLDYH